MSQSFGSCKSLKSPSTFICTFYHSTPQSLFTCEVGIIKTAKDTRERAFQSPHKCGYSGGSWPFDHCHSANSWIGLEHLLCARHVQSGGDSMVSTPAAVLGPAAHVLRGQWAVVNSLPLAAFLGSHHTHRVSKSVLCKKPRSLLYVRFVYVRFISSMTHNLLKSLQ